MEATRTATSQPRIFNSAVLGRLVSESTLGTARIELGLNVPCPQWVILKPVRGRFAFALLRIPLLLPPNTNAQTFNRAPPSLQV